MKKKLLTLFFLCTVALCMLGAVACSKEEISLRTPEDCSVRLGTYYSLPLVEVSGAGENVFADASARHSDGAEVAIEYNRIRIDKLGTYTIRYYYEREGEVLAEGEQKLTVVDDAEPLIMIEGLAVTASLNSRIEVPTIKVADSLGESPQAEMVVSKDGTFSDDSKIVPLDETKKYFVIDEAVDHYVKVTATNSRGVTATKIQRIYVRDVGEIESADTEAYVGMWEFPRADSLAFNGDPAYIKAGEGSMRLQTAAPDYILGMPTMLLYTPTITDLTDMASLSFWVYNNGTEKLEIQTLAGGIPESVMGTAYPGMWTKVELSKAEFEALVGWNGIRYDLADFKEFSLMFKGSTGTPIDVFVDEIRISYAESSVSVEYAESEGFGTEGEKHTCLAPAVTGLEDYTVSYDVYTGNEKIVPEADNSITLAKGVYTVIATVKVGAAEYQASYEIYIREAGEIESGDAEAYLGMWGSPRADSLTYNSDPAYIKAGEGSMRLQAALPDYSVGMPTMLLYTPTITDLTNMTSLSFWVYNNGAEKLEIQTLAGGIPESVMGTAYPGMWTKVELSKAEFEALVGWNGIRYNLADFKEFSLMFKGTAGNPIDVYVDEIRVSFEPSSVSVEYAESSVFGTEGAEYTCAAPTIAGLGDYTVTYAVYKGSEKVALTAENTFTLAKGMYAVIAVVKTDTAEYQASYEIYVRGIGEIDSGDAADLLSSWSPFNGAVLTWNGVADYVKEGTGSLHFTAADASIRPLIRLDGPAISDFTQMKSFSFWIYNNGAADLTIETLGGNSPAAEMGVAAAGEWTKIELTKEQFEALSDWSGTKYDLSNMEYFWIICYSADGGAVDVYVDDIRLNY